MTTTGDANAATSSALTGTIAGRGDSVPRCPFRHSGCFTHRPMTRASLSRSCRREGRTTLGGPRLPVTSRQSFPCDRVP